VFQVESSGMRQYLRQLKPTVFEDIIAMVALYRPGPMKLIDDFIKRKHGESLVEYPLPQLESCLKDTYGIIVYQEQVMEIARVVAGYSLGQADLLRRAMGKKDKEIMAKNRAGFVAGAAENGVSKAAADAKVVSSMGNQGHSSNHIRMVKEWYEAGFFGEISTVEAWDGQYMRAPAAYQNPAPQPKEINWDLWLGPAKFRPYFPGVVHAWRPFIEFGSGSLGDMAAHIMDPAYYILDLGTPEKIELLERKDFSDVGYAAHAKLVYHFPANGKRGPVKVIWRHGRNFRPKPPEGLHYEEFEQRKNDENLPPDPRTDLHPSVGGSLGKKRDDGLTLNGSLFYGEKLAFNMGQYGDFFYTAPHEKFAELKAKEPPKKYPRYKGHYRDWVGAIRNGTKAVSDFNYAGPLTEVIIMGNIALRLGRDLNWDAKKNEFVNDAEANALIKDPAPRAGFHA
jgi:predicted dehydrogenase